jgi:hypothetical protein
MSTAPRSTGGRCPIVLGKLFVQLITQYSRVGTITRPLKHNAFDHHASGKYLLLNSGEATCAVAGIPLFKRRCAHVRLAECRKVTRAMNRFTITGKRALSVEQ